MSNRGGKGPGSKAGSSDPSSLAGALKKWEEKNGAQCTEASEVKLMCQVPPLTKLDNSIGKLRNCKKLSLSTNCIDRIIPLPALANLKILSLGRNQIRKLSGLEELGATLEELWISYNFIEKVDGLQCCANLRVLYMSNNKIRNIEELEKLATLPHLKEVLFKGNPFYANSTKAEMKLAISKKLPKVSCIDGEIVTRVD